MVKIGHFLRIVFWGFSKNFLKKLNFKNWFLYFFLRNIKISKIDFFKIFIKNLIFKKVYFFTFSRKTLKSKLEKNINN